jgi:hypothetical protein
MIRNKVKSVVRQALIEEEETSRRNLEANPSESLERYKCEMKNHK